MNTISGFPGLSSFWFAPTGSIPAIPIFFDLALPLWGWLLVTALFAAALAVLLFRISRFPRSWTGVRHEIAARFHLPPRHRSQHA